MAEGSYDHYVPKFLLKRFSRRENAAMLHRLHVQKGDITDAQVRTEARRKHLDTFPSFEPAERRIVAKMFRDIETKAGEAIGRVCSGEWDFNEKDRIALAYLVAIHHLRVPRRIEWTQGAANVIAGLLAELEASDPDNFRGADGQLTDAQRAEQELVLADLRSGRVWVEADPDAARGMAIAHVPDLTIAILNELQWTLLFAGAGSEFVLGDDPLTMHDPTPKVDEAAPGFLSSENSQTALPLSPSACLLLTPGPPELAVATLKADDVDELNLRSYAWACSGVYARSKIALERLQELVERHSDRLEALRPRPPQQFVFEEDLETGRTILTRYGADGEREVSETELHWRP